MNVRTKTGTISLDWDKVTRRKIDARLGHIGKWYGKLISSIQMRNSPSKGKHVRIKFTKPLLEASTRFDCYDDPMRIVLDILRPDSISQILWDKKVRTVRGRKKVYKAGPWKEVMKLKCDICNGTVVASTRKKAEEFLARHRRIEHETG